MIKKPMLSATLKDFSSLNYPVIASPKIDGIRCVCVDGQILSRSFKQIPNKHINKKLSEILLCGMDGEILSGSTFQECTSNVMSHEGEPDFEFHAFDFVQDPKTPYVKRIEILESVAEFIGLPVKVVPTTVINNEEELLHMESVYLEQGHEGLMLRSPDSPYKFGRSTEKQQWLLKLKRFVDSEAEIIGFEELCHNENILEKNELGYAKRSHSKAGMVPADTLGKFLVRDIYSGVEFSCGTGQGLTQKIRKEVWDNRSTYLGKTIKYKSQPIGVKEKPRLPVWLGFRDGRDQ